MNADNETIFALSTAAGRSGVAVFRVSGPRAFEALKSLCSGSLPEPKRVALKDLRDPKSGDLIDSALVFRFVGPSSFTGEDMVEIQCHGSLAVIASLDSILSGFEGFRPAHPGEFSKRTYDNGKMDLLEAEGLGDLIHAETEAQRKQAMGLASGDLSKSYLDWRAKLIDLLAYQEALIDFSEEDLPDNVDAQRKLKLDLIREEIERDVSGSRLKQAIRDGIRVVLIGDPNAGKSSLLNALSKRDAAIVTDIKGTTRDLIEVNLDMQGFPIVLTDTAGLRESADEIERIGIERAVSAASQAEILIELVDHSVNPQNVSRETFLDVRKPDFRIGTKADLVASNSVDGVDLCLSTKSGENLSVFESMLGDLVSQKFGALIETPSHTRARHRAELDLIQGALSRAVVEDLPELSAESIRISIAALDRLVGRSDVEDVLDVIFSDFCIGK